MSRKGILGSLAMFAAFAMGGMTPDYKDNWIPNYSSGSSIRRIEARTAFKKRKKKRRMFRDSRKRERGGK